MRCLLIANYKGDIGGISGQVKILQKYLEQDGHRATIFSTRGNCIYRLIAFFRLLCMAHRYDVLHIHGCSQWGFLPIVFGVIAGKLWKKRIVVTYHGGGAETYFAHHCYFVTKWLNRTDIVIVLNGYLKQVFDKYDIPCVVIPNILELSDVVDAEHNAANGRFISVRHLRDLYNIPCILRAFEFVHRSFPSATLTILGQGPLRGQLEQWTLSHGLSQCVTFVGQVPNIEIPNYLSQSDIMLSAPHIDNMPVSVLEAMNAGVLVISSRVGGVPYIIDEDTTGLLFEDDNAEELADKMLWSIYHPQEVQTMITMAQQEVQKYKWENIKEKIYNAYGMYMQ